jgi:hypothetical protein
LAVAGEEGKLLEEVLAELIQSVQSLLLPVLLIQ